MDKLELQKTANEVRKGIVTAVHSAKAGHPGGSLSAADIFTYLYFEEMNIDPKDPKKADRDRFVLSKGHTAPGLYSTLAQRGYFPVEDLKTLRHLGSYLQGHPDMKHIPGVDMSSGSLGQGISAAVGMALSAKLSNDSYRVYTLLGDGEIQEGQVWEASMFAGARKLDNLVVIVDNNGLQIDGKIEDVCSPYPIDKKFEAFNFHVINVDAHDYDDLKKHEPGFVAESEWGQYCLMENAFNSLKDLLDGAVTGNQFDRKKQMEAFAKINADTDGTCGRNVYEIVKGNI